MAVSFVQHHRCDHDPPAHTHIQTMALLVIPGPPFPRRGALPLTDGNNPRVGGFSAGPPRIAQACRRRPARTASADASRDCVAKKSPCLPASVPSTTSGSSKDETISPPTKSLTALPAPCNSTKTPAINCARWRDQRSVGVGRSAPERFEPGGANSHRQLAAHPLHSLSTGTWGYWRLIALARALSRVFSPGRKHPWPNVSRARNAHALP